MLHYLAIYAISNKTKKSFMHFIASLFWLQQQEKEDVSTQQPWINNPQFLCSITLMLYLLELQEKSH